MKTSKLLSNREIASFCQQTYYLLQAGITPFDGMDILLQDAANESTYHMIEQIKNYCAKGEPFSAALKATERFPEYVIHMVSLGEESGHLSNIMQSLAYYYDREENIAESIRDAVRYPLIMIAMMLLVILVLIAKVLPIFSQVYSQLGTEMTGFARSLLHVSNLLSSYSLVFVLIFAILIAGTFFVTKNRNCRMFIRNAIGKLPFIKNFSGTIASGRFASGMALTLSSGLDTFESLDMISKLVENKEMIQKIAVCKEHLKKGSTFAEALKSASIFSAFYTHMVMVGFRSGALDTVMQQIADHYEQETDTKIHSLISTLEPTLVIILSLFVGMILLSVIMPLMGIMSMIG